MSEYLRIAVPPSTAVVERRHASTDRANFVVIPERRLLAIDGIGKPRAADYQLAAGVLVDAHRAVRARLPGDRFTAAVVRPVAESLWWPHPDGTAMDSPRAFTDAADWHWRQMIELQSGASDEQVLAAIDDVRRAAGRPVPLVRHVSFVEGPVAQLLHVGDQDHLPDSVGRLFEGIAEAGRLPIGYLHILVLADPERVPRGRGRLIVRQPIA